MTEERHFDEETYKNVIRCQCETEEEARKLARQVLCEYDVYGDSYGVPTIADIVEQLVELVKTKSVVRIEPNRCNCCGCILADKCGGQL